MHLWTQIVGKIRVAHTPWVNHQWHVALYPTPRGLATSSIPYHRLTFEFEFNLINHALEIRSSDGRSVAVPLTEGPVAAFHAAVLGTLNQLDIDVQIHSTPNEMPGAAPFREDMARRT